MHKLTKPSMSTRIRHEILSLVEFFVMYFPEDYLGRLFRNKYWEWRFKVGKNSIVHFGAKIVGDRLVEIGSNFVLGMFAEINAGPDGGSKIFIGNYVGIAKGSYILNANHKFDLLDEPILTQGHESKKVEYQGKEYGIVIENDVWIGANVVVLTGTHIGTGSIIGANAVVSGAIPPYSIVLGNPGRVIGNRVKQVSKPTS